MSPRSVAGLRIAVTGAAGGIGGAAVAALRARGAEVAGIDLIDADGHVQGDVRDAESMGRAVAEVVRRLGGLDVLVNNAGIGTVQDSGTSPDELARRTLEVNLLGAWVTTSAALPHLLRTRGHVVNVASALSWVTIPYTPAYAASKRGLVAYSDTLRIEYAGRLTVTTVYPGYVRTAIHAGPAAQGVSLEGVARAESVDQAALAIVRACADRPRELSTSRATAVAVAAARYAPRLVEAVVRRRRLRVERSSSWRPDFLRPGPSEPSEPA